MTLVAPYTMRTVVQHLQGDHQGLARSNSRGVMQVAASHDVLPVVQPRLAAVAKAVGNATSAMQQSLLKAGGEG